MTETGTKPRRRSPARKRWAIALNVVLFAIALGVLHKILTEFKFDEIMRSIRGIPYQWIAVSLVLTLFGYMALIGYDFLSLKAVGKPVSLSRMWLPSYVSHAVQNSAPVAIVAGGGVRYKLFRRLGLTAAQIGSLVGANLLTFLLGLFAVAGLSFIIAPLPVPKMFHLPANILRPAGFVFVALVVAAAIVAEVRTDPIRIGKHRFTLPGGGLVRLQLGVSSADWLLSSGALYVLLLGNGGVPYLSFLTGFLLVQIVTQVVPLPGGVGVFEAAMLLMRPASVTAPRMTAALVLYRVIYYLIPLVFAAAFVTRHASGTTPHGPAAPVWRFARKHSPYLLAVSTFLAGVILLFGGAIPGSRSQVGGWLQQAVPAALIEASRFFGSLAGFALLVLAWGLQRKVYGAFRIAVWLLALAIPAVLIRSSDVASAVALLAMLFLLLLGRAEFTRRTPVTAESLDAGWVAATIAATGAAFALAFFAHAHSEFAAVPWWRVSLDPDAPPMFRLVVTGLTVLVLVIGFRLVARARTVAPRATVNRRRAAG